MQNIVVRIMKEEEVMKEFKKEFAEVLIDEEGWWFENGLIIVMDKGSKDEVAKTIVHEVIEYLLENEYGLCHNVAHELAKSFEENFAEILEVVDELR